VSVRFPHHGMYLTVHARLGTTMGDSTARSGPSSHWSKSRRRQDSAGRTEVSINVAIAVEDDRDRMELPRAEDDVFPMSKFERSVSHLTTAPLPVDTSIIQHQSQRSRFTREPWYCIASIIPISSTIALYLQELHVRQNHHRQ
jgi:hypothetical protein